MSKRFLLLAALSAAFALSAAYPPVEEVLERGIVSRGDQTRLRNFFNRAEAGGEFTVGVLGGSITEGALCSDPALRYHGVLLDYLKERFPKAKFKLVNAGVGATGSDYGALRLERDLLGKKPDLVILEFAVNDGVSRWHAESYEGIVRQILAAPGDPALLLLFMMRKDGTNAQQHQVEIGKYYQLPMLSCRDALYPEIAAGKMTWAEFSPDTVHPNAEGHSYTGKLLTAFLAQPPAPAQTPSSTLPKPLFGDRFVKTSVTEGKALKPASRQGWTFIETGRKIPPDGWEASTPGSTIEFETEGEMLFLSCYHINGPMGKVEVQVDGKKVAKVDAFFEATWGGRIHTVKIAEKLSPGSHKVTVTLLEEKHPQSTGNTFRITGFGGASQGD